MSYAEQLKQKKIIVEDALRRIGGFKELKVEAVCPSPKEKFYRNRVQFQVSVTDGVPAIGFYRRGSHEVSSMDSCLLLPPVFMAVCNFLRAYLVQQPKMAAGLNQVVLQSDAKVSQLGVYLIGQDEHDLFPAVAAALAGAFPVIKLITQSESQKILWGDGPVRDKIGGLSFAISPGAFVQINSEQREKLYDTLFELAGLRGDEDVLDVYCGIGAITLPLATRLPYGQVTGIEEYPKAVLDARQNAAANGIANADFLAGKAEKLLPEMSAKGRKADLIVLDPPRQGCGARALAACLDMSPSKIIMVSCAPATLARDLRILADGGYNIKTVRPFDMFPQTTHVETVVLMSRADK